MGLAPDRRSHVRPCRTYQRDVGGPLISLNALAGHRSTSWRLCVTLRRVLVELTMTEQRYRAVLEVQAGVPVTDVAERFGVSRQAVHRWRRWYETEGLDGLSDRSHRPNSHPAQTSPEVEAAICELRRTHPRWGQRRIEFELGRNGCPGRIPSRITIHRVLVRHGL